MNYNYSFQSLKDWDNFPIITQNKLPIQKIEWNGIVVKNGDMAIWHMEYDDGGVPFDIDDIRLAPVLSFWSSKHGGWFHASSCHVCVKL
jgi:hypothetical protein